MSNYSPLIYMDAIIYPCPNPDVGKDISLSKNKAPVDTCMRQPTESSLCQLTS